MKLYNKFYSKIIKKISQHNEKRLLKNTQKRSMDEQFQQLKAETLSQAQAILEIVPTQENTKIIGENWLAAFKNNSASEHGEDGIISKIFSIMPPENKWVCEFGAHDPENISNTWHLINKEGWHALLIEADDFYFNKLKEYYKSSPSVHCVHTKVSYEGSEKLDTILEKTPAPVNLDFMVIDIDGNDYHVWEAIESYQAKLVMIEFNASIPSDVSYVQPKDMSLNKGSSLKAMVDLANKKGYKLIAVTAWNAFFIQQKYYHLFFNQEPALTNMYVYPVKHPIWMRAFQLYDGTLMITRWDEMLWHKIDLAQADYQTLPESYRFFNRKLANKNFVIEDDGSKNSVEEENSLHLEKIFSMPGNVMSQYAHNHYSRYGEDGILEQLVKGISCNHLFFVDVGSYDGVTHSRSRNLTIKHNWHGLLLEDEASVQEVLALSNQLYPQIKIDNTQINLVGEHSLDAIFKKNNVPQDFEILFLNSFGMEYYLWESLREFTPRLLAIQFNPSIPNDVKYVQPNDFNLHQGCSLRALLDLAHYKDYELVAVTMETAFFVHRKFYYRLFELFGLRSVDLDEMFSPFQMKLFQLYDGTIALDGLNKLMWHGVRIDEEKLQVVPKGLRKFHQFADPEYKSLFYRVS
jgi:hypothetical protein